MGRKSNGEGSVSFETALGLYRACITGIDGKRIVKRFKKKSDANQWLAKTKADIMHHVYVHPTDLTVGEWLLQYLEVYKKPIVRPKTLSDYVNTAGYIINHIGNIKIQKLSAMTVQKFYNDLAMSARTKIQAHRLLKAAINQAVNNDILVKSIMTGVVTPKAESKEIEVYTKEEVIKILTTIKESRFYKRHYPLFLLAFTTGARIGELIALRCSSVKDTYIIIKETRVEIHNKDVESEPKTKAGRRRITISPEMQRELKKLIATRNDPEDFVFHNLTGEPYTQDSLRKTWKRIIRLADVPNKPFHAIRHTHATQLIANGIPIPEVAKRLGHSRISHTLNLYSHAIPNYDEALAKKLDSIFLE